MIMGRPVRKLALTVHLVASLGWIGAALAYLALGIAAASTNDASTVRAAWAAMELIGWSVIVPLALAALVTGLVLSLGTGWGLFRHYWLVISLGLTLLAAGVTVLHMPDVSALAAVAQRADDAELVRLGGDLVHPGVGLVILLGIAVLNIYKPRGLTPLGQRRRASDVTRWPRPTSWRPRSRPSPRARTGVAAMTHQDVE